MDRAAVLEDAFDSRKLAADPGPDPVRLLRRTWDLRSSANVAERSTADEVPLLIFNSTVVGGNTRAVTSALQLSDWPEPEHSELTANSDRDLHPLAGNAQVTAALCGGKDLRLSTSAILAGRFPFVSPSARITPQCSSKVVSDQHCATAVPPCEMELVDGGYTDNSGLFSLEAMVPTLRALVREHNEKNKAHRPIALVLVELDNHFRASINQPPSASSTTGQTLAPLATAFGGHAAIENYARAEAYRVVPAGCTITISPGLHPGLSAPVGWELSAATRKDLREGLVRKRANLDDATVQPVTLLRKLQGWLTDSQSLSPCVPD
jgi:hypothetical protein